MNGSPTTAAVLAQLGALLVDLHGQHETQSLLHADAQRDILDAFAHAEAERASGGGGARGRGRAPSRRGVAREPAGRGAPPRRLSPSRRRRDRPGQARAGRGRGRCSSRPGDSARPAPSASRPSGSWTRSRARRGTRSARSASPTARWPGSRRWIPRSPAGARCSTRRTPTWPSWPGRPRPTPTRWRRIPSGSPRSSGGAT